MSIFTELTTRSKSWLRAALILAAVGFTIGTLLDGAHTHTHKIEYTTPVFWMAAWWTPFVFACGSLTTGLAFPLAEMIFLTPERKLSLRNVIAANAIFYISYILSGYLPFSAAGTTAILILAWILLWFACDRTPLGIGLSLITAVWGPLLETALSRLGVFHYVEPDLYLVASWLPALYAIAAIGNGHLGKALVQGLKRDAD